MRVIAIRKLDLYGRQFAVSVSFPIFSLILNIAAEKENLKYKEKRRVRNKKYGRCKRYIYKYTSMSTHFNGIAYVVLKEMDEYKAVYINL